MARVDSKTEHSDARRIPPPGGSRASDERAAGATAPRVPGGRAQTVKNEPGRRACVAPLRPFDHWLIIGTVLAHLAITVGKPPQVDDTLYLETARGILADPLRPLMNTICWEQVPTPIYKFAVNPPLYSYQQALLVRLFGWNLPVLHLLAGAYVLLAAVAMHWLARRFSARPTIAFLLFMTIPTFLPQTNLMLDTPGMALVAATVAAWIKGVDERSRRWMFLAALCAAAAVLTKYNSAVVLPLVLLYSGLRRRWLGMAWIALPLAALGLWCLHNVYVFPEGRPHLLIAKSRFDAAPRVAWQQLILSLMSWGCAFVFLPALAAWSWVRRRGWIGAACLAVAAIVAVTEFTLAYGPHAAADHWLNGAAQSLSRALGFAYLMSYPAWKMPHWPEQVAFVGNAALLAAFIAATVIARWRPLRARRGDGVIGDDLFLLAWVVGMSMFNCLFAPHHAPRYYFPAYPAIPLLLARGLFGIGTMIQRGCVSGFEPATAPAASTRHNPEDGSATTPAAPSRWMLGAAWASVVGQALMALILAGSDHAFAAASRDFVQRLADDPRVAGRSLTYVGHWGFQYWAQQQQQPSFTVMDVGAPPPAVGSLIAVVMDTGWGEFPWWLKQGPPGREQIAFDVTRRLRNGVTQHVRCEVIDGWDAPHPWPLQTVNLERKLLLYSPRFYHNRLPYGRGDARTHRMVLLRRVE